MTANSNDQIDTVMKEKRLFAPPKEFAKRARIKSLEEYQELWDRAAADPPKFWADLARDELHWFEPFKEALIWKEPFAQWFAGGKTNVSYNCLDRNIAAGFGGRTAILWEGEPGDTRTLTYAELHREVCKFANVLKQLDIQAGDRVSIYMPMVPELAIAMLACADRRDPLGDLRRLFSRGDCRSQSRRRCEVADYGRLRLAARQSAAAQANRGRCARQESDGREVHRAEARRGHRRSQWHQDE